MKFCKIVLLFCTFIVAQTGYYTNLNDAVESGAPEIRLSPNALYIIDSSLVLHNGQSIIGGGWSSVIQAPNGLTDAIITNEDTSGNDNITLKDFRVFGNGEKCSAIEFLGSTCKNIIIDNIWSDSTLDRAIVISGAKNCKIINCKVTSFGAILYDGQSAAPIDDGIRLTYASGCLVSGNFVDNSALISDLHGDSTTYGRHGICLGSHTTESNIIINNTVNCVERHGINAEGEADKLIISGNNVNGVGTYGIVATGEYLKVTSNHIENSGEAGIVVGGLSGGYNIVTSNTVINSGIDTLDGNTQDQYLCGIVATTNSQHYLISNNICNDNAGSGIYLEKPSGVCNGNICKGNGNVGVRCTSEDWIMIGNRCLSNLIGLTVSGSVSDYTLIGNIADSNSEDNISTPNGGIEVGNNGD